MIMQNNGPRKVVYLFGTGATHAEKSLQCKIKQIGLNKINEVLPEFTLLARDISRAVFLKILDSEDKNIQNLAKKYGIVKKSFYNSYDDENKRYEDLESFISMIESNKTDNSRKDAKIFREFFKDEILLRLKLKGKEIKPCLYSALLEYHDLSKEREKVLGFLTLNYETLFEKSFKLTGNTFNYGFQIKNDSSDLALDNDSEGKKAYLLLKLHGSFYWYKAIGSNRVEVSLQESKYPKLWIPPGLNKDYLDYPYNLIHGKAYELLNECQVVRVIGCSLNKNDFALLSLLFKTQHLRRKDPYIIDLIADIDETWKSILHNCGGFLSFDECFYVKPEWTNLKPVKTENTFLDWLYLKSKEIPKKELEKKTDFLKEVEKCRK